jgi:chromosome segregation ATPase
MTPTDHKAALRKLAAVDDCEASRRAADHIEYIERRLASALDSVRHLKEKLHNTRQQRNELRRQLMEKEHGGDTASCNCCSDLDGGRGDDRRDGGAAVEPV